MKLVPLTCLWKELKSLNGVEKRDIGTSSLMEPPQEKREKRKEKITVRELWAPDVYFEITRENGKKSMARL